MEILKVLQSIDANGVLTKKYIFATDDDLKTEATYVDYKNKHIICYSSQIGCKNNCKFCYNGINSNFRRNLTADEIFNVCYSIAMLNCNKGNKPILFSAMGIGDALDNYNEWSKAVERLYHEYPSARYAVSSVLSDPSNTFMNLIKLQTSIHESIRDSDRSPFNLKLQISVNTPFDMQRKQLMPFAGDLDKIFKHITVYMVNGIKIDLNYVLMDGINDTLFHAMLLAEKIKKSNMKYIIDYFTIKINKFNKIKGLDINPSSPEKTNEFINFLTNEGFNVEYYETNGSDIDAACGQLSGY